MDKLRELYRKILAEQGKNPSNLEVIVLNNQRDKEIIESHIKEHFDYIGFVDNANVEEFLDVKKDKDGFECDVLIICNIKGRERSIYFELRDSNHPDVQSFLKDLREGEELHIHIKGESYSEVLKRLSPFIKIPDTVDDTKSGYIEFECEVKNEWGLHARPSAKLAELCMDYEGNVYIIKDSMKVNGKSVIELLSLAAEKGDKIKIKIEGTDEKAKELEKAIRSAFDKKFGIEEDK